MEDKRYLTPNEAADLLMVSPTTVRFWAQKGALKSMTTPGGHRRFSFEDLELFAKERGMRLQSDVEKLRILIIDDDVQLASYLVELFEGLPNPVETEVANYSFEAGLKVRSFNPHVILLDLMMPGLDGFQVCQMLKSDAITRKIRVIAMTGYPSHDNVNQILAAGAETCISKPIDTQQLLKAIGIYSEQQQVV